MKSSAHITPRTPVLSRQCPAFIPSIYPLRYFPRSHGPWWKIWKVPDEQRKWWAEGCVRVLEAAHRPSDDEPAPFSMALKRSCASDRTGDVSGPNVKRKRSAGRSLLGVNVQSNDIFDTTKEDFQEEEIQESERLSLDAKDKTSALASTLEVAGQTVAPFLARHIPSQYAPLGTHINNRVSPPRDPNSRYCYRHRPDLTCRRQADEPSMDKLQKVNSTCPIR